MKGPPHNCSVHVAIGVLFGLGVGCTHNRGSADAGDGPAAGRQDAVVGETEAGSAADGPGRDASIDSAAPLDTTANDGAASCPMIRPTPSSACPAGVVTACSYGDMVCACYPQRVFLSDGGVSVREGWGCTPLPPAPCPNVVPAEGAPCAPEGQQCNYDVRACAAGNPALHVCTGGVWRVRATPCSSGGPAADGGAPSCEAALAAAIVKDCASAADCTLVDHNDCCGTVKIAVKTGTEASFAAADAAHFACVPGCGQRGCFHADLAEEGGSPGSAQVIAAECRAGRCLSVVRSEPGCNTSADCSAGHLCVAFVTNLGPTTTTTRQCRANPCAGAPLACPCAGSLCVAPTSMCAVRGGELVCDDGRQ